ncbi:MAG: ABC transporter ATP-binding protein [Dehalococcoidia bacterium]|nr:ABC transporter ATP-binding protein [Dehalococcoidia bacterium]
MSSLLKVDNIQVNYGPIKAIRDVSLEVPEGSVVAMVGANGAGKSTMLRTISGLLHPVRGSIEFRGRQIQRKEPHQIVGLGIVQVPEGRGILTRMSLTENLRMGAYLRKDGAQVNRDLDQILERFPALGRRATQQGGTLSGGEQQMLAIARALMARPQLLMLDEPSLGLAPLIVREIFLIIRELKAQGITVLLVEQNTREALRVADYGYVLSVGKVAMQDTAANLLGSEAVVRAYLGHGASAA